MPPWPSLGFGEGFGYINTNHYKDFSAAQKTEQVAEIINQIFLTKRLWPPYKPLRAAITDLPRDRTFAGAAPRVCAAAPPTTGGQSNGGSAQPRIDTKGYFYHEEML